MRLAAEGDARRNYDVRRSRFVSSVASCSSHFGVVAFKVYDMDRDGFISNGELFLVLKMMVGNNLKVRFNASLCSTTDGLDPIRIHNSRRSSIRQLWRPTRTAMAS